MINSWYNSTFFYTVTIYDNGLLILINCLSDFCVLHFTNCLRMYLEQSKICVVRLQQRKNSRNVKKV